MTCTMEEIKLNIRPTWNAFPGLDEWKKVASPGDYVFIFDACPSPLRINFDGTGFTDVHGHKFDMEQWKALAWIPWPEVNKETQEKNNDELTNTKPEE